MRERVRDAADAQKDSHFGRGQGPGRLDRDLLCLLDGVVNQCQRAPAEKSEALRAVVVALARQLERERQGRQVLLSQRLGRLEEGKQEDLSFYDLRAAQMCARIAEKRAAEPGWTEPEAALGEEEEEEDLGGEWDAADELVDWVGGGSEHMVCFQALRKREEAKAAAGGARRQLHVRLHIRYAVEKLVSFIHQSKNAGS